MIELMHYLQVSTHTYYRAAIHGTQEGVPEIGQPGKVPWGSFLCPSLSPEHPGNSSTRKQLVSTHPPVGQGGNLWRKGDGNIKTREFHERVEEELRRVTEVINRAVNSVKN
jgi:hypothetical protein